MKYLSFDLRALGFMRLCIAAVIMLDLSVRISDLEAFYSNTGVVPLPMLFEHGWNDYFLSIHVISGLWQVQLVLVLFFIPVKHQFFRFLGVLLIVLFHFMNGLTLFIGMFPLIGMATSLGMLPSYIMDKLDRLAAGLKIRVAASFVGVASAVQYIIRWKAPVYEHPLIIDRIKMAVLIFLTVFVFDWNFSNLTFIDSKLSDNLRFIGYALRLDQNWGMFAPGVFKDDGWYILEGKTEKNEIINLLDPDEKINYQKPESIVAMFKNDRWRKYTENLIFTFHTFLRGYYCNYSKRIWNEAHPDRPIKALEIIYMSEFTLPDYKYSKPERVMLWECH